MVLLRLKTHSTNVERSLYYSFYFKIIASQVSVEFYARIRLSEQSQNYTDSHSDIFGMHEILACIALQHFSLILQINTLLGRCNILVSYCRLIHCWDVATFQSHIVDKYTAGTLQYFSLILQINTLLGRCNILVSYCRLIHCWDVAIFQCHIVD